MSQTSSLPTYTEIADALKQTSAKFDASEIHGLLCGLISATSGKADIPWKILLGNKKNPKTQEILLSLYEYSYHQMSEFSFEFNLLLPNDLIDLNQRAEALGLWCQGFIVGLERGKVQIQNRPPSEMTDALNDLIEISEVDYGNIDSSDDDEAAYFELVEYVRLAVLMIFHELRSTDRPKNLDNNNLIH